MNQLTLIPTILFSLNLMIVTPNAVADDWQVLFDGSSLSGWKAFRDNSQFELIDGVIVASSSNKTQFLSTEKEYQDFELEYEVKIHDQDLNSGVQFRSSLFRVNDKGQKRESLHGPQVELTKSPGRSGLIFGQGMGKWITPQDQLIKNDFMINGDWNRVRLLVDGPHFQTWINDQLVTDLTDQDIHQVYPQGVIALQVHGVKNNPELIRHVSFRSIRIRELKP